MEPGDTPKPPKFPTSLRLSGSTMESRPSGDSGPPSCITYTRPSAPTVAYFAWPGPGSAIESGADGAFVIGSMTLIQLSPAGQARSGGGHSPRLAFTTKSLPRATTTSEGEFPTGIPRVSPVSRLTLRRRFRPDRVTYATESLRTTPPSAPAPGPTEMA